MGEQTEGQPEETQPQEPQETEQPAETPETPPEEVEAKAEDEGAEEPTEEPAEGQEEQPKPEEKHRRDGGWKRRIDKLERAVSEKDQVIQQLSQRLGGPTPPAPDGKPKDPNAQVQEYVAGLVREQLQAERTRAQQEQQQAGFQRRVAETRAAHPDFEEVLQDVAHMAVPAAIHEALLTSEKGPAIMYQLAKNPAELARISALPPFEAAREIGRLEALASSTPAPKAQTKSATRPPAPPTNVGGNSSSARSLDDLPLADYKRAYRSGRR